MLTINIICVGKLKEKFFKDAIDEYSKRLSKYCKLNIIELPDEKIPEKTNPNIENEIKTNNIFDAQNKALRPQRRPAAGHGAPGTQRRRWFLKVFLAS